MLMPRNTDAIAAGCCRGARFNATCVDVTETARELCRGHLCGPAASRALGEALAAVAFLAVDAAPGERAILRMNVNGPLQGLCVEAASRDGFVGLRGYPHRKVIAGLDESEDPRACDILGNAASVQIALTNETRRLHHAAFEIRGGHDFSAVLSKYHAESVQRPLLVHVATSLYGGYLNFARAFVAAPLPDADPAEFDRLQTCFLDGTVSENLDACVSLSDLCAALKLDPPECPPPRPVRFHCGCSRERVLDMLARLGPAELRALAADGAARDIIEDLIETGVEILDPVQWRCPGMEREGLARDFGERLVFHGGVDNQQTLPFGTTDDVREEVLKNFEILGANGGYILGPCHNFQPVGPPENAVAMYETGYNECVY
ncbi:MAG: Hsp33 family molecular chaperone HslO [Kiritimatiellaeota bacterium]|nr:Hsp33 family molecular chaperone HslO [Kiritimatiellota bacterium]